MADAREIALRYLSPRYLRLQKWEQYVEGNQYDGRVPFLVQSDDAPPLHERAPCIVYGIADNAIGDLIDFMMGERRYPQISACSSEDDEELDGEWGLDEEASALLERWTNGPLTKAAQLKAVFADALAMAMGAGGVALVGAVRNGQPCLTPLPAKWCTPTFNAVTGEVIRLEVFYPYIVEEPDPQQRGKWVERCKLYKRVIDAQRDVVFLPADGREDAVMPVWKEDPEQSVTHALGFCPVRWFPFDRKTPTAAHFDGKPLHALLLDEIDALNFSLSQRHRAALYTGDPQIWETGVEADVNPAPMARFSRVTVEAQAAGPRGEKIGVFTAAPMTWGRGSARKKGPGIVWRYPNTEAKVGMLTLPDGALGGLDQHASDLRKKLAEDMSVVLLDPTDVKAVGALSGRALAFVFARQIARADRIRQDAGEGLILACVDMLLRICLAVHKAQPGGLRVPGIKKIAPILEKFVQPLEVLGPPTQEGGEPQKGTVQAWFGPRLELQWGRYFAPTPEEENYVVTMCVAAKNAGLMPDEVILEKLRDVFVFGSTEELMERLEEQKQKAQEAALESAAAMAKIAGVPGGDEKDGKKDDGKQQKPGGGAPFGGGAKGAPKKKE